MQQLLNRIEAFGSPRIVLVGDFILDRYVYGDVERINPEAPVPVLRTVRSSTTAGGAGNVAAAIAALGGTVRCAGVIGDDEAGGELRRVLERAGVETDDLLALPDRPTAVKTRYVGLAQHRHAQQMLRVDQESTEPLAAEAVEKLAGKIASAVTNCDLVALEDYNKGVLSEIAAPQIIKAARRAGRQVVVDPAYIDDYRRYRGATLLTPNRYETALATGIEIVDDDSLLQAAERVATIAEADAVVITLDREGAYVHRRGGSGRRIPHARPRSVYDVTGAGDEVLAALAVGLAEGCSLEEATALANVAGGLEVERFGAVPITRREVTGELRRLLGLQRPKVLDRRQVAEEVARRRQRGQDIVFTNGCFDLLHAGHVTYLRQARELGSCLIVAINSDDGVRRLKGNTRPIIGQNERANMLAALECVDYVTIFDEDTPHALLELLRPDILVKGGTTPVVIGREVVEAYGGKVLTLGRVEGLSTTEIIDRIANSGG
jgi:D-beta-D-heptose 7-phosphate kinase/D-beta-D-heptose 1-phosphate adenosyltransferase